AGVGYAQASHDGDSQRGVDQRLTELGAAGVVLVEVDLVGVVGEQGEPDVVGLRHRAADAAAVDVAGFEVLVETPGPAWLYGHGWAPPHWEEMIWGHPKPRKGGCAPLEPLLGDHPKPLLGEDTKRLPG